MVVLPAVASVTVNVCEPRTLHKSVAGRKGTAVEHGLGVAAGELNRPRITGERVAGAVLGSHHEGDRAPAVALVELRLVMAS